MEERRPEYDLEHSFDHDLESIPEDSIPQSWNQDIEEGLVERLAKLMDLQSDFSIALARLALETYEDLNMKESMSKRVTPSHSDASEVCQADETTDQQDEFVEDTRYSARQTWSSSAEALFADFIQIELSRMVFGSNFIERAGTNFEETLVLCRKVFADENITSDDPEQRGSDGERGLLGMLSKHCITSVPGAEDENIRIRGRQEVIQHARALKFFLEKFNIENAELTTDLILQTHRILCEGHDHDDGSPWQEWAGVYRDCEIAASSIDKETGKRKKSIFIRAAAVPKYMEAMVRDFNDWATREGGDLSSSEISSWLCTQFVNIHPFADGNGRICRILLNGVLFKYTGMVACIGDNEEEGRDEYLEIANKAAKIFHREDGEVEVENQTSHFSLANLVSRKSAESRQRHCKSLRALRA